VLALVLLAGGVTTYRLADAGRTTPTPAVPIATAFLPEATAPTLAAAPTETAGSPPIALPAVPLASAPVAAVPSPAESPGVTTKSVPGKTNPSGTNLALNGTATASAVEGRPWSVDQAVDGDPTTRWSSGFADPQWIRVDLRKRWQLTEIRLLWEHAYGVAYRVDTSLDGRTWHKLWSTTAGAGGTVSIDARKTIARYVRMYGTKRNSTYGYSLLELEVR
jgi:F5/8 type C domain